MLPDLIRRGREPSVGITVSEATITLRITAAGPTPEDCLAAMEPTVAAVHECLGTLVFGEGDDELQHVVARLLARRRQSLAVIEWGTSGLVTQWLREAEQGGFFHGGIVIADSRTTQSLLRITPSELQIDPCSPAMAKALAAAGREMLRADYTLAVSDFPADGAMGDDDRFHIALATPTEIVCQSPRFTAHPSIQSPLAAKRALDLLRLTLLREVGLEDCERA
jgi:nicotinamide-nucleotide amidase